MVFDPDKGLLLNGRRVKVHGVCEHHDLGCLHLCRDIQPETILTRCRLHPAAVHREERLPAHLQPDAPVDPGTRIPAAVWRLESHLEENAVLTRAQMIRYIHLKADAEETESVFLAR